MIVTEAHHQRSEELEGKGLNGIKMAIVSLKPTPANALYAEIELFFYNTVGLADVTNPMSPDTRAPKWKFPISGGSRLKAGPAGGQVQVTDIKPGSQTSSLILRIDLIGDYSPYTLTADFIWADPVFDSIEFKFRPGCFNTNCAPDWDAAPPQKKPPMIDYLARDFPSFRDVAIDAMMRRVPGWEATSGADLDMVLLELCAAAGDELADFHDRVMNEAYFTRARQRIALARHARLMDYHIHQGNQADTWLYISVGPGVDQTLPAGFVVKAGAAVDAVDAIPFATVKPFRLHHLINQLEAYSWSDTRTMLAKGTVSADLDFGPAGQTNADTVRDLIFNGHLTHLVIEEKLNPKTGGLAGVDPNKRQVLELERFNPAPLVDQDPFSGHWYLSLSWKKHDALKHDYHLVIKNNQGRADSISAFHGNLVKVFHGEPVSALFKPENTFLAVDKEWHYYADGAHGVVAPLPHRYLAYRNTPVGGSVAPETTLRVTVTAGGLGSQVWNEVASLTRSLESDPNFIVETDEQGFSLIRFGNGVNGMELPEGALVHCTYQVGTGRAGNIGGGKLVWFDTKNFNWIVGCRNPIAATNGRDPEAPEQIIRRVPQAYRYRQERAVTLADYAARAEALEEVSKAAASYAWTGSWRTVRLTIDPVGDTTISDALRLKLDKHLNAVRLIGEDLEIRAPEFVPLNIRVTVCIAPNVFEQDMQYMLEQAFTSGYNPAGEKGFFHPDHWTFGQALHSSQIAAVIQRIPGVRHVDRIQMKRWRQQGWGADPIKVGPSEIILVRGEPNRMEDGYIFFEIKGGRQ